MEYDSKETWNNLPDSRRIQPNESGCCFRPVSVITTFLLLEPILNCMKIVNRNQTRLDFTKGKRASPTAKSSTSSDLTFPDNKQPKRLKQQTLHAQTAKPLAKQNGEEVVDLVVDLSIPQASISYPQLSHLPEIENINECIDVDESLLQGMFDDETSLVSIGAPDPEFQKQLDAQLGDVDWDQIDWQLMGS
jgi:hypothetical protein